MKQILNGTYFSEGSHGIYERNIDETREISNKHEINFLQDVGGIFGIAETHINKTIETNKYSDVTVFALGKSKKHTYIESNSRTGHRCSNGKKIKEISVQHMSHLICEIQQRWYHTTFL